MSAPPWYRDIEAAIGRAPVAHRALSGGSIAEVQRIDMPGGETFVVKLGGGTLALEGWMLGYLGERSALPVPEVVHASDNLLIMTLLPSGGGLGDGAQAHAAELLAGLHGITAPAFGLERDTVIGPLPQPNPLSKTWVEFFRDHRLLYMARACLTRGAIDAALMGRIENLAAKLDGLIAEPAAPALIHGDMWTGNVLVSEGRISGFVDPAIYYADPEIELAFGTLFGTFSDAFFKRYTEIRPIRDGFFEVRLDIYNLWHLLTHVHLFGAGYLAGVTRVLDRHGA